MEKERKRRLARSKAKSKSKMLNSTYVMGLSRSGKINHKAPKSAADMKYGMGSVSRAGVQQNTSSIYDFQEIVKSKKKEQKPENDKNADAGQSKTNWYRKPKLDQRNPYIQCKYISSNVSL